MCHLSCMQAAAVCRICDQLLQDVICDSSNCVSLLLLAKEQPWESLESRCLQVALDAPLELGPELPSLPRDDLMQILSSDHLKVGRQGARLHSLGCINSSCSKPTCGRHGSQICKLTGVSLVLAAGGLGN